MATTETSMERIKALEAMERIKVLEGEAIEAEERFRGLNADFGDLLDRVDKLEGKSASPSVFPPIEKLCFKRMDELSLRDQFVHNRMDYTLESRFPLSDDKMAHVCFCHSTEFFEVFTHKDMLVIPK